MSNGLERITGAASIKRYFNSEYIGAYSLDEGAEPILTIDSLWFGEVVLGGGRKESHVIMRFRERSVPGCEEVKPLILNSTNRKALKKMYGSDSAEVLEGKRVQLYVDPKVRDPDGGGFTEGLRIRPKKPPEQSARPSPAPACSECGKAISGAGRLDAAQVAKYTESKYGRPLCGSCAEKEAHKAETAPEPVADVPEGVELL